MLGRRFMSASIVEGGEDVGSAASMGWVPRYIGWQWTCTWSDKEQTIQDIDWNTLEGQAGSWVESDAGTAPVGRQTIGHMEAEVAGEGREGGQKSAEHNCVRLYSNEHPHPH